jgi:hypothetical protein
MTTLVSKTPALFCIYDSISPVPGFHDAEVDWNGWACPSFTLEAGKRIVAEWNGSDGTTLSYDEQRDAFVYVDPSYPEEPEIYGAETITVNGAPVKAYPIGAFGWTWEEVPARDANADDTPPECPQCGGPGILLGTLGSTDHYRCRNCGWGFSS